MYAPSNDLLLDEIRQHIDEIELGLTNPVIGALVMKQVWGGVAIGVIKAIQSSPKTNQEIAIATGLPLDFISQCTRVLEEGRLILQTTETGLWKYAPKDN